MFDVLLRLPAEAASSKELVVQHLGLLGQMSKSRDISAAWNSAKRQVVRERPERFCLDGKVLRRTTSSVSIRCHRARAVERTLASHTRGPG